MPTRLRRRVISRRVTVTDARGRLRTMCVVLPVPVPKVSSRHGKHTETGIPYGTGADIPEETWQEFVQALADARAADNEA